MLNVNGGNFVVIGSGRKEIKFQKNFNLRLTDKAMMGDESDIIPENSQTTVDEVTPAASRAQSNYSTYRTKLSIAPVKWGENRTQYLWRLLRCSIRRTIDAVARADDSGTLCLKVNSMTFVKYRIYI